MVVLLAAAALLPTGRGQWERLRLREGEIARERVVAPYDFPVQKDEATLRREQEEAGTAVPPVLVVDARAQAEVLNRWPPSRSRPSPPSPTRAWARTTGSRACGRWEFPWKGRPPRPSPHPAGRGACFTNSGRG